MKALFWHDWQVCKNRGIFWAVLIGNLVLAIAITSYTAGTAQSNGFSPQQVHSITASLMAIWVPLLGVLAVCLIGPCNGSTYMRYLYPVIACMPFAIGATVTRSDFLWS